MDRQKRGKDAEQHALLYLSKQKLRLIEQNFNCRFGEIDLIMQDGECIVFIEVRLRTHAEFGGAAASVTITKQRKIIKTAQLYLNQHPRLQNKNCRFDVIAYEYDAAPTHPLWYKDAFRI